MTDETTKQAGRKQVTRRAPATFAGYVRVSRQGEREDDRFRSPTFQRETIERFAAVDGLALTMYPDEIDVSGSKSKRPTLEAIVRAIEAGELAGMIVAKLDRLSRLAPRDRLELLERIEAAGGVILSASESNDVSTPEGRFVRELFLSLARMEWERKRDAFALAKSNAIANGIAVQAVAPFGYLLDDDTRMIVDPIAAPIVVRLYEMRAGGASYGAILSYFEETTGRTSSRQTMKHLLQNRTFLGELRSGENVREHSHPAIVELELFEAVQAISAAISSSGWNSRAVTLLAGIAKCAGCGKGLSRSAQRNGGSAVYKCQSHTRHCSAHASINTAVLDEYVIEQVLDWAGPVADELVELEVELGSAEERVVAEHRLEQARASLIAWASDVEAELDDAAAYQAGLRSRQELVAKRERELVELGEQTELELARGTIRSALRGVELDVGERRRLLAVVLDRVVVRKTPRYRAPASERAELIFATPASTIA